MKFSDLAKTRGIHLLKDDFNYLRERLSRLPAHEKNKVLVEYIDVWCKEMADCDSFILKQNHGRCAANQWIREKF
jgi:hypothetical protein